MEIERFAIHDGPGIRTVVFLQGCPLHCPWCSNPESRQRKLQLLHMKNKCVGCGRCAASCPHGNIAMKGAYPVFDREACVGCRTCERACPQSAIQFVGDTMPIEEIMRTLVRDKDYYRNSGGGITFSGGEAFTQFEGLTELLSRCKAEGLHTAVETCGQVPRERFEKAFPLIDLFLFDVKHTDSKRLKEVTGADLDVVLGNLRYLAGLSAEKVTIRMPVIPGFNYDPGIIRSVFDLAIETGISQVHLLPYHTLGKDKYERLGLPYPYPYERMMQKEELQPYREIGQRMGLEVRLGG